MICGVLYVVKRYDEVSSEIHYAFDTKSGQTIRLTVPISIPYKWLAYLDYNPADGKLYGWDNGNQIVYDLRFDVDGSVSESEETETEQEEKENEYLPEQNGLSFENDNSYENAV